MVKELEAFKFNQKISLKSRILLGVFLIIYLYVIVNSYQSEIEFGDKTNMYLIGMDEYSTRDKIVEAQQLTTLLFILPILIVLLNNRILAYILTLLTVYLSIEINRFVLIPITLIFMMPLLIVIYFSWKLK